MPVSSPRSVISIPSVTMKPFSRKRTMNNALIRPTAAPTSSTIGMAHALPSSPSPCETPTGAISQAAIPGASPNVDSSERSILPTSSTSVSARTRTPISDIVCRTLMMLSSCRNTGLTIWPTIAITTIAGTSARSRSRASGIAPIRAPPPGAGAAGAVSGVCSITSDTVHPLHRGDQVVVAPAAGQLAHDPAAEHHEHAIAAAQVVQLVGDDQHAGTPPAGVVHDLQQRLLAAHVHARRGRDQHEHPGVARQRPAEDHLLLVAARQRRHRQV